MAKRLDQHTHIFVDRSLDDDIMAESLVTNCLILLLICVMLGVTALCIALAGYFFRWE